ncbi:hypothetical protein COJ83_18395 [Bacillus cereus]|uniref:hypothetical protein n=1 Tax=Bacillus cereus TaxID=1396 RepID=UPI000BF5851E|nr:hypothetical protein [Bacillus cereus]PFA00651.1 hypothetical protein CN375_04175 [Bacillus cereus]PFO65959.1 hypothetical protein COJ83_18395 [Bacillus cereus]
MKVYIYELGKSRGIVYANYKFEAEIDVAEHYSTNSDEVEIKLKEITNLEELREYTKGACKVIAFS